MSLRYTILVFLMSLSLAGIGQTSCSLTVNGKVSSKLSGISQSYYISLNDSISVISDDSGRFRFRNVCPGTYDITVKIAGINEIWSEVVIKNDTTLNLLFDSDKLLSALDINGSFIGPNTFIKKRTLDPEGVLASGGSNLTDLASNIPGVSGLKTGSTIAKPIVSGMVGRRVVIYNNGVRLEGQDWGSEHGPEIDAQDVNSITVIKGPGSLRYASDALGGLILVESIPPRKQVGVDAGITLAGMSNGRGGISSGFVNGRLARIPLSWKLQGSIKRSGNVHTPDYFLKNTGSSERDFSASLAYTKKRWEVNLLHSLFTSQVGIFSGSHIGNLTDLQNAFEAKQPFDSTGFDYAIDRPYQDIIHELSKVNFKFAINEIHKLEINYSRQYNSRQEFDKDLPYDDSLAALNLPDFSLEITTHTGELLWSHKPKKQLSGFIGITGKYQANTHAYREFIPNFINQAVGGFWIEQYAAEKFALETAIRYDHNFLSVFQRDENNDIISNDHEFSGLAGSLGGLFTITKSVLLNVNLSSGWRMPWVNELYSSGLHHGVAALEYGDDQLEIERSLGINISPEYESDKFKLTLDIYGNLLNDYIFLRPAEEPTLTIQGAFPTFNFQQTDAWSGGLDFMARYQVTKHISVDGKGSIVRIQDRTTEEFLPGTPSDRFSISTTFQTKTGKINWSIAPRFDHIAKQWRIKQEADFVPAPEAYSLLGATAIFKLPFKSKTVTAVFRVDNLLNTNYRDYLNRFRYYANDLGRNYTIKLNIPFNITKNEKHKP